MTTSSNRHSGSRIEPHHAMSDELPDLAWADLPHDQPFCCRIDVADDELSEVVEHVSNIEYVRWLDRAAELHADSLGWTRRRLLDMDMMWFVARHEIDYLAETWRGDRLIIATWVQTMAKVKSQRSYAIVRPSDRTIICRASTVWVLVKLSSRRPTRIPAEILQSFQPFTTIDTQTGR